MAIDIYADLFTTSWVQNGLQVAAGKGLSVTISAGLAYISGSPFGSRQAPTFTMTVPLPRSETVFIDWNGSIFMTPVTGSVAPGFIRLAQVTTNATTVTNVTDLRPMTHPTQSTAGLTALGSQTVGTTQVAVPHGLGSAPTQILITMTSNGVIYKSAASDSTNVYLKGSLAGLTAEVYVH